MSTAYPKSVFAEEDVFKSGGSAYSCIVEGGALKPKLCAEAAEGGPPSGTLRVMYAPSAETYGAFTETALHYSSNNKKYINLRELQHLTKEMEGSIGFMVETRVDGVPFAVFINGERLDYINRSTLTCHLFSARLFCGVMHCGRLFGADADNRQKIVWTTADSFEKTDVALNEGGYLFLDPERGDVLDMLVFGGKITLVREYGITVLSFYGSPENFGIEFTNSDTPKIFKDTAKIVSGRLLFFTAEGLMSFDGNKTAIQSHAYSGDIYGAKSAAEFGGKYYLSCLSKSAGAVILCLEPAGGECYLIKADADVLYCSDAVYGCKNGSLIKLSVGGKYEYTSGKLDFGTHGKKTVTEIFVGGVADLEISCGNKKIVYTQASGLLKPHLRGKEFVIRLSGNTAVESLTAKAEVTLGI